MIRIYYKPTFIRQFNLLEEALKEEVIEKVELFKNRKNHQKLKVHKLKGRLIGRYSFSVNYKIRIVFNYLKKNEVVLLVIGDHKFYKR